MKILISHLTGNANVKAAASGLLRADMLGGFYVSMATFPDSLSGRLAELKPLAELRRRSFHPAFKPFVRTWPWFELGRILALKSGLYQRTQNPFDIDRVVQNFDRHVAARLSAEASKGINAVYGYEDTIGFSFREAKRLGMTCLYDLPIGYWRAAHQVFEAEKERWPAWAPTLTGLADPAEKLARKDEELRMADQIFVASSFTARTLEAFPGTLAPVEVIPYGFPPVNTAKPEGHRPGTGRPLQLLFVGSLSQRKGIANLFEAVEKIGPRHVELTLVGQKTTSDCPALEAALERHRWFPSMPHAGILTLMRQSDVLVFPSLFEGFGLVITEAMSQGTPVITTDRTIGPDVIRHGENGWLIQAGATEALIEAIEELLIKPESMAEAGREAILTAAARPWERYGQELAAAIQTMWAAETKRC